MKNSFEFFKKKIGNMKKLISVEGLSDIFI
jgi:hypothetical protein